MQFALRRRLAIMMAFLILAGGIAISTIQPAHAATRTWVALGDSYSSGTGSSPYDADAKGLGPPASADGKNCQRASSAYAPTVYLNQNRGRWDNFVFAACRGAVTSDVIQRQASALNADTTTVSLTIGGNDVGFATTMATCLINNNLCLAAITAASRAINVNLPQKLDDTYKVIRTFAPNAKVFVLDYPQLYDETPDCGVISLSQDTRRRLNTVARELQTVIEGAVQRAGAGFVAVDIDPVFKGHRICSSSQALTDATSLGDAYHPNNLGHDIIASALDISMG
jgi:lysophospholipase L1-like esterase